MHARPLRCACTRSLCRARGGGHALRAKSSPPGGTALSPGPGSPQVFNCHLLKMCVLETLSAASSKRISGMVLSLFHFHPERFPFPLSYFSSYYPILPPQQLFFSISSRSLPSSPTPPQLPGDLWSLSQCFITG